MSASSPRTADYPVHEQFIQRWSPRAFQRDADISEKELFTLFEAARWAPSAYDAQPWRFIYARRGDAHWDTLLGLLDEYNRVWAQHAAALVVVASQSTHIPPGASDAKALGSHAFDTGCAWGYLALQASFSGWHTHAMAGFDRDRARTALHLPADLIPLAAVAIGKLGDKATADSLPEALRQRESPSPRNAASAFAFAGSFSTTK